MYWYIRQPFSSLWYVMKILPCILQFAFRQADEMSEALTGGIGGRAFTDDQINTLAHRHFERLEVKSEVTYIVESWTIIDLHYQKFCYTSLHPLQVSYKT